MNIVFLNQILSRARVSPQGRFFKNCISALNPLQCDISEVPPFSVVVNSILLFYGIYYIYRPYFCMSFPNWSQVIGCFGCFSSGVSRNSVNTSVMFIN